MSFQKFKSASYYVGGRHRSATKNIYGNKTCEDSKVLIGYCSICDRKESLIVTDNTIQVESLDDCFRILCKKGFICQ